MRFEIAVAAVLAAEDLSSSGASATAQGTSHVSSLQERARIRKNAIESIPSNQWFQKTRGQRKLNGVNFFSDSLRRLSEARLGKISGESKTETNQSRAPGDHFLDLGILPSAPGKEERKRSGKKQNLKVLKTIKNSQFMKKATSGDTAPSGLSVAKENKQNNLKEGVQKVLDSMNQKLQKVATPDQNALPDLGIFSSGKEKMMAGSKPSASQKDDRRLQDAQDPYDYMTQLYLGAAPLATLVNVLCYVSTGYCDTCEVTYLEEGTEGSPYDLKMSCIPPPEDSGEIDEMLEGFQSLCDYNLCESTCSVDIENFQVDMKGCSISNTGYGFEEIFAPAVIPEESDPGAVGEIFDDIVTQPLAFATKGLCEGIAAADSVYGTKSCEECSITYIGDDEGQGAYNIDMNCPSLPENLAESFAEGIVGLQDACKYNVCEVCNIDADTNLAKMQNCSFARLGYDLGDLLDYVGGDLPSNNGDGTGYGGDNNVLCPGMPTADYCDCSGDCLNFPTFCACEEAQACCGELSFDDSEYALLNSLTTLAFTKGVEATETLFVSTFEDFCATSQEGNRQLSCGACGAKSTDDSSFSFEVDCLSKFNASDSGFDPSLTFASAFCACPEYSGLQCSTCDVNILDGTVKIDNCVALADQSEATCINQEAQTPAVFSSDPVLFALMYGPLCAKGTEPQFTYLQDFVVGQAYTCTFDRSTKTSSIGIQEENCQTLSYCPENPLELCRTYQNDITYTNGKVSNKMCVTFSSPNDFSVCIDIKGAAGIPSSECEMEVDGIRCNSCSVISYEGMTEEMGMGVLYNCSNTVIGDNGPGDNTYQLLEDTISYFIYQSLPCPGGCDLCGGSNEFMTNPNGKFASEFLSDGKEDRCLDANLDAMTGRQSLTNEQCQAVKDIAREPCGCKNPNPPAAPSSGAHSFGTRMSAMGGVLLTMAAASVAQMLLG